MNHFKSLTNVIIIVACLVIISALSGCSTLGAAAGDQLARYVDSYCTLGVSQERQLLRESFNRQLSEGRSVTVDCGD